MSDDVVPVLERAAEDMRERAEDRHPFDLGVYHITGTPSNDAREAFLLVGVNTEDEDCVAVFDEWLAAHDVEVTDESEMDEAQGVVAYEIQPQRSA